MSEPHTTVTEVVERDGGQTKIVYFVDGGFTVLRAISPVSADDVIIQAERRLAGLKHLAGRTD